MSRFIIRPAATALASGALVADAALPATAVTAASSSAPLWCSA